MGRVVIAENKSIIKQLSEFKKFVMKYLLETVFDSPHLETSAEIALSIKSKKNDVFSWLGDNLPWSDSICLELKDFWEHLYKKLI